MKFLIPNSQFPFAAWCAAAKRGKFPIPNSQFPIPNSTFDLRPSPFSTPPLSDNMEDAKKLGKTAGKALVIRLRNIFYEPRDFR